MAQLDFTIPLVTCECYKCGMTFAMPREYEQNRRRDHVEFCCPSGHWQRFFGKSDVEVARAEACAAQAKINEAQHLAAVAQAERDREIKRRKKIEKRIAGGACPCCNRTFENLQRHMASKHKDFPKQIEAAKSEVVQ